MGCALSKKDLEEFLEKYTPVNLVESPYIHPCESRLSTIDTSQSSSSLSLDIEKGEPREMILVWIKEFAKEPKPFPRLNSNLISLTTLQCLEREDVLTILQTLSHQSRAYCDRNRVMLMKNIPISSFLDLPVSKKATLTLLSYYGRPN